MLENSQLVEKIGCGGLQRSECTSPTVPGGVGRKCLKNQRSSGLAWTIDADAERPPSPQEATNAIHTSRVDPRIPPPLAPSSVPTRRFHPV